MMIEMRKEREKDMRGITIGNGDRDEGGKEKSKKYEKLW